MRLFLFTLIFFFVGSAYANQDVKSQLLIKLTEIRKEVQEHRFKKIEHQKEITELDKTIEKKEEKIRRLRREILIIDKSEQIPLTTGELNDK